MATNHVQDPRIIPASLGTRRLTLDSIRTLALTLEVREVETTIPAGFQIEWGTVDVRGDRLLLTSGAGFGSGWATINFRDKLYAISGSQLVESFLDALERADAEVASDA